MSYPALSTPMCTYVTHMLINLFAFCLLNLWPVWFIGPQQENLRWVRKRFFFLTKALSLGVERYNIDLILAAVWDGARIYYRSIKEALTVYWKITAAWSRAVVEETEECSFFAEYFTSEATREFLLNPAGTGNNSTKLT